MRIFLLYSGFAMFCSALNAQVNMNKDAPAHLHICVRDSLLIDPVICTDREIVGQIVNEVVRFKKWNSVHAAIQLSIEIIVNERGTIIGVHVNKNGNTLENSISDKLWALSPLFPARENGSFVRSVLKYYVDDMILQDYATQEDGDNSYIISQAVVPINDFKLHLDVEDSVLPFMVVQEPPSTKKCASLTKLKERQSCFTNDVNEYIKRKLGKRLRNLVSITENQRLFVMFKVDNDGMLYDIQVRFKDEELVAEVIKSMKKFPQVVPARHLGTVVSIQFVTVYPF